MVHHGDGTSGTHGSTDAAALAVVKVNSPYFIILHHHAAIRATNPAEQAVSLAGN